MPGPKEWGPKEEPKRADLEFAGLRFMSVRTDEPGWREGEESYHVLVMDPGRGMYQYAASVPEMDKYQGLGHLQAVLDSLTDIREVKEDFQLYRMILRDWMDRRKADAFAAAAEVAARGFDAKTLERAADIVAAEMNKIPSVKRKLKRGWEELMRRRPPPTPEG